MTDKLEALKAKKPADTKTLAAEKAGYVTDDNSGGYYVVECQECGEIYPSQECDGGGPIADTGDYNDALCPHCGCESPNECNDTPLVWNVQQAKINALLAALEEKDQRIAELEQRLQQPALADVMAERKRQISAEGWTPEHDDQHASSEMAGAAACYARHVNATGWVYSHNPDDYQCELESCNWPWDASWWKPTNPRRDLVKAGALILAEIERLDRADAKAEGE